MHDSLDDPVIHVVGLPRRCTRAQNASVASTGTHRTMREILEQRQWRAHEIAVQEEERRRLARDLHDEAGHRLTAAALQLDVVVQQHSQDPELRNRLEAVRRLLQDCAAGLHEVAFNLRPSILADLGLVPAIRSLARRAQETAGLQTSVQLKGSPCRLPEHIELAAFRIVQEALTNVLKYGQASTLTIMITFSEGAVVIAISDDGIGFDMSQRHSGRPRLGLTGMRERAELVGGNLRLQSKPGHGTTVWARLPWIGVA